MDGAIISSDDKPYVYPKDLNVFLPDDIYEQGKYTF
jgi:hypothetical protein